MRARRHAGLGLVSCQPHASSLSLCVSMSSACWGPSDSSCGLPSVCSLSAPARGTPAAVSVDARSLSS